MTLPTVGDSIIVDGPAGEYVATYRGALCGQAVLVMRDSGLQFSVGLDTLVWRPADGAPTCMFCGCGLDVTHSGNIMNRDGSGAHKACADAEFGRWREEG